MVGLTNATSAGHANITSLFPLETPPYIAPFSLNDSNYCHLGIGLNPYNPEYINHDIAPWEWWDNNSFGLNMEMVVSSGYIPTYEDSNPLYWECKALLSNPDMSEKKGLAFVDMLDDFFTPRILSVVLDYENFNELIEINEFLEYSSTISENSLLVEENIYLQEGVDSLSNQILELQQEILVPNIYVDLAIGWNMVGFSCPQQRSAEDALVNIVDNLIIFKNNNGNVYMPEFSFNGIGDLTPGHGRKVTDYILDFNILSDKENLEDILSIYELEKTCEYRGETYRVRDNGSIFRCRKLNKRKRPLDEKWTFGVPCKSKAFYFSLKKGCRFIYMFDSI